MDEKVRDNVYVVNCDDWCLFDFTSRHSHSHFLDCPCMMDDVAGALAGTAAGANPARVPLGAPRWYQLTYPRPGPLPAMATLWKTIGALAINAPMMALVKAKKRIQLTLRVLQALTPFLPLVGSFVLGSLWADSPLGLALMLGSAAALLAYGLAWVFGWAVQRREDAACGAVPSQGLPVPQPAAPAPHEETIFERNMRNLKTFFSNRPRLKP